MHNISFTNLGDVNVHYIQCQCAIAIEKEREIEKVKLASSS